MAEVMLLLVFCLLLALSVLLSKEQSELRKAREELARATGARDSTDHLFLQNPQLREALEVATGSSSSAKISELWHKLTDSHAAMNELERNGVSAIRRLAIRQISRGSQKATGAWH